MQEPFDKADDREVRLISDAVINLYAAHVHSLLYQHDHPLISDSLRNAYQRLQKAFRKNPLMRIETSGEKLMVNGELLEGDMLVLGSFASWLTSMRIRALSFSDELTRRELIIFHKSTSKSNVTSTELSRALSEKNITSISVHPLDASDGDASMAFSGSGLGQKLSSDLGGAMFYMESDQKQAPFFTIADRSGQHDIPPKKGLCKDYISTMYQAEKPTISSPLITPPADEEPIQTGDALYAATVEALIDNELPRNKRAVIQGISPPDMAHLLNAMLFRPPDNHVAERITEAYFERDGTVLGDDIDERCRLFLAKLKADLRPSFAGCCASFCKINDLVDRGNASDNPLEPAHMKSTLSLLKGKGGTFPEPPPFVLCRTLEKCDYTFDFVACGNAVIHDIELPQETACLFDSSPMDQSEGKGVPDALPQESHATADDATSFASIIAECTDEAIADASFEVILEMLDSTCLDSDEHWKLEGKLAMHVEMFMERGEFGKVLDVINALKRQSLQGTWCTHASAMIRNIFSSDKINMKLISAVRQHGRKQRESAGRLTVALRSFLIPYLLDALCEETDTCTRKFMMTLLTSFRGDALEHIAKHLRDSRWYVIRNMLYLLRECHGRSYTPEVRDFLEHKVPLIRLEALRTLLSFQDPDADTYVITFLRSTVFQLQKGAVRLAGAYRIKPAVPQLIALLQEKDILGKRSLFKKGIIRALGRIGDSSAISHLLDICRTESILNKKELSDLKTEVFRTLPNYPVAAIGPLLEYGMQSNDEKIMVITRNLMNRYGPPAGKQQ